MNFILARETLGKHAVCIRIVLNCIVFILPLFEIAIIGVCIKMLTYVKTFSLCCLCRLFDPSLFLNISTSHVQYFEVFVEHSLILPERDLNGSRSCRRIFPLHAHFLSVSLSLFLCVSIALYLAFFPICTSYICRLHLLHESLI